MIKNCYCNKCSDRSMEVQLFGLLGNYDRYDCNHQSTDRPTNKRASYTSNNIVISNDVPSLHLQYPSHLLQHDDGPCHTCKSLLKRDA